MIDLSSWAEIEIDPQRRLLRQAMRLVIRAIANSEELASIMVMKGGVLLAIRYNSPRFTTDIDFSTQAKFADSNVSPVLVALDGELASVSADNEYGLTLRIQSHSVKPANQPERTFPTLSIKVGFAQKTDRNQIQRLQSGQAARVVSIDYSYNEWATGVERQQIEGGELQMYGLLDLIAEKLRSILQQPIRNRSRFQDIYDVGLLIGDVEFLQADRTAILEKLRAASADRDVPLSAKAMRNQAVIELAKKDYNEALPPLISSEPVDFEVAYEKVREFFESLPW